MVRVGWLLLAAACSSARQQAHDTCDALLACASVANPFLVRDFDAAYGEEGVCWDTSEDPALCEDACEDALVGLWVAHDHAEGCDPEPYLDEGELPVALFLDRYQRLLCAAIESCDPDRGCYGGYGGYSGYDSCPEYDPEIAARCLEAPFVCSDERYGNSYPIEPPICEEVCG